MPNIIGPCAGTCIREGPGLAYRTHTKVPEDDWVVMIINGSCRAAGDPSGGTGWVCGLARRRGSASFFWAGWVLFAQRAFFSGLGHFPAGVLAGLAR